MFNPPHGTTGKKMKTKTLSNIREQHTRLWLAALGNIKRCNTLDRIYWRYVQNIKKHLNTCDPFAYKPYYTPVPASIYAKQA